jgi:formamidopyrimidine-DNA glycosylase
LRGRVLGPYTGDPAMPELPDVTVYLEALAARIHGARLERVRLAPRWRDTR